MTDGWVKLHRSWEKSPTVRGATAEQERVMIRLLLRATHTERELVLRGTCRRLLLPPGAVHTTLDQLADLAQVTPAKARGAINYLVRAGWCTKLDCGAHGTLLQITKWSEYQSPPPRARPSHAPRTVLRREEGENPLPLPKAQHKPKARKRGKRGGQGRNKAKGTS